MKSFASILISCSIFFMYENCSKSNNNSSNNNNTQTTTNEVDVWVTKANQSALLQKQNNAIAFSTTPNIYSTIEVDANQTYQVIDGFGFTLTGGSAYLINKLSSTDKINLLNELFGNTNNSIGLSYLRVSLGASDLSTRVFSYNDLPIGQTDINLTNFSLADDTTDLIPLLKQILNINPNIKILASPWSAPVWMKSNSSSIGGTLLPQYYQVYANYFVKYIEAMKAKGINIDAITVQNEPEHGGNNPSMLMTAAEQANFIKNNLGPTFQANNINTKIIIYDHNCDHPNYPISVLNDAAAKQYITGSAFHLYAGDISALSSVYNAHNDKKLYFTEQWTGANGTFSGDLIWHVKNVIIGSMRNYSSVALEWNLANDAAYMPHTTGGCTECKGALTISGSSITRNVAYYNVAHASKFMPAGSVRIASNNVTNLANAAFVTPAGKKVLVVVNDSSTDQLFNVKYNGKWFYTSLTPNTVATYVW